MVFQDFNPKYVLIGRQGRGIFNHTANILLRNRVRDTYLGYEIAGKEGQKLIAATLVNEVLKDGGQFVHIVDGQPLTEKQAIANVRRRFDQCRAKNNPKRNNGSDESVGEQVIKQEEEEHADGFPAVANHPFAAADQGIYAENLDPPREEGVNGMPPVVNHHAAAAAKRQYSDPRQDMDPGEPLGVIYHDELGDKARLRQKVSEFFDLNDEGMLVDRGEEMAGNLLSILDLAASDGTVDELLFSDQMRESFKSIVLTYEETNSKRARRGGASKAGNQNSVGAKEGTKSVVTCGKKSMNMESILSGFESALRFDKDAYIDKLDIVGPRVHKKGEQGEKTYFGATLNGMPHGLGFMIYTNKEKWLWGHWRKGKLHGFGGAIYENNHRCFGLFVKEQLHGKALYKTDESQYLGE